MAKLFMKVISIIEPYISIKMSTREAVCSYLFNLSNITRNYCTEIFGDLVVPANQAVELMTV